MSKGKLYLIPSFLGEPNKDLIPVHNQQVLYGLTHFIAEREKTARAFLKAVEHPTPQSDFEFYVLDKHTKDEEIPEFLLAAEKGTDIGLLSEAGLPCVADPGAKVVNAARKKGIDIVPLSGLSSIMMALMASGMNGQQFRFHGYLPIDNKEKSWTIKQMATSAQKGETQIFIETPYRNNKLLQDLIKMLPGHLRLAVAADLTLDSEEAHSKLVNKWKSENIPDFHKRPAVFLIGL